MGSTIGPIALTEVWANQPQYCEHGRAIPITPLSCGGLGGREISSYFLSHQCLQHERELTLPLIYCSMQESGFYTMPGQYSRAGPEGGRSDPEDIKAELASPLLIATKGELVNAMQKSSLWW